ncbi:MULTISPECIES: STAS domain-containing protein [unclassified Crossiella]|uniref:STAS domain-containing protein n=1 Tax=Crossiella sp. SN42 TaxID=2944808 RepID=UPI00207C35A4|nr:STAS domain-containing protein [Crossiella sp. SN42]MCO1581307.1 STAS domain-containing protein [Crossiella sp. SN42]
MTEHIQQAHPIDLPGEEVADTTASHRPGGIVVITVVGELDMSSTPAFQELLGAEVDESCRRLVVDLTGVSFLGSSGLAALVEARQVVQRQDAELRLVCATHAVTRPLHATGLGEVFDIHQTLDGALA